VVDREARVTAAMLAGFDRAVQPLAGLLLDASRRGRDDGFVRQYRDSGTGPEQPEPGTPSRDRGHDEYAEDPLAFETVILPARLDSGVARRVALAADREGVSIADLLGRAAAAYDWRVDDEDPPAAF
jgi:hypothetical protein